MPHTPYPTGPKGVSIVAVFRIKHVDQVGLTGSKLRSVPSVEVEQSLDQEAEQFFSCGSRQAFVLRSAASFRASTVISFSLRLSSHASSTLQL